MSAISIRSSLRAFWSLVRSDLNDVGGMVVGLLCLPALLAGVLDHLAVGMILGSGVLDMLLPGLLFLFLVPVTTALMAGPIREGLDARFLTPPGGALRFASKILIALAFGALYVPWVLCCFDPFYSFERTGRIALSWMNLGHLNRLGASDSFALLGVAVAVGFTAWVSAYIRQGFHSTLTLAGIGVVVAMVLNSESLDQRWIQAGLASPIEVFGAGGLQGLGLGLFMLLLLGAYLAWRPRQASIKSRRRAWGMGIAPLGLAGIAIAVPIGDRLTEWRELNLQDPDLEFAGVEVGPGLKIAVLWHRARTPRAGSEIWLERPGFLNLEDGSWIVPDDLSGELEPIGWDSRGHYWVRGRSWGERARWVARIDPRDATEFERYEFDEDAPPWGVDEPKPRPGRRQQAPLKFLHLESATEEARAVQWSYRRSETAAVRTWPGLIWGRGSEGLGFAVGLVEGRGLEVFEAPHAASRCLLEPGDVAEGCYPTLLGSDRWLGVTSFARVAGEVPDSGRVYVFDRWADWSRVGDWEHSTMVPELLGGDPSKDVLFLPGESVARCVDLGSGRSIELEGLELGPNEFREWDRTRGAWLLSEGRVLIATPRRVVLFREDGSMERVLLDFDVLQGRGVSNRE